MPEIRVVSPRSGNQWQPGAEQTISFRVLDDEHPGEPAFNVHLNRGPFESFERVLSIDPAAARWHSGAQSYSFPWRIPRDLTTGDDYFIEVVDRRTPTGASGEHFSLIGPIEVLGGGTRYVSNPTRIRWRVQPGSGISRVAIRLMDCVSGGWDEARWDIRELMVISRGVPAAQGLRRQGRFEWRVGGNRRVDGEWVFDCSLGESWSEFPQEARKYFYRVSDTENPDTYCDGPLFQIRLPVIQISAEPLDDEGMVMEWNSSDLVHIRTPGLEHYRVKVMIEGRYQSAGRFECDRDGGDGSFFCIATEWPEGVPLTWRWGESVPYPGSDSNTYPDVCRLPALCTIKASVRGFRWIASASSQEFWLPCDDAPEPNWAGYW